MDGDAIGQDRDLTIHQSQLALQISGFHQLPPFVSGLGDQSAEVERIQTQILAPRICTSQRQQLLHQGRGSFRLEKNVA